MKSIVQDLLVGIILTILSSILGLWIYFQYQKPIIEVDNNGGYYGLINGIPIGSVFVGNSGYATDKNISIKLDDKIDPKQIDVPNPTIDYDVKDAPDGTIITLKELRPTETAQIFFSPRDRSVEYYKIVDVMSDSNRIYYLYYVNWWNISFELKVLFGFLMVSALFLGWYIPKRVIFYRKRI